MRIATHIRNTVQRSDTLSGRVFDAVVLVLIVVFLVAMSLSTVPGLSPAARAALATTEMVLVVFFTVEYLLRVWTASHKWSYILSFYGLVDLLSVLPFWLSLASVGLDLRVLRALRLLRVFRVFRVARGAIARLGRAAVYAREEALVFLVVTLVLLYIAATGIHHFESEAQPEKFRSVFDSLWWAVVTLTTVGYGDAYPVTAGGRIFTFIVLLLGMGVVAVPAGLVASGLSRAVAEKQEDGGTEDTPP